MTALITKYQQKYQCYCSIKKKNLLVIQNDMLCFLLAFDLIINPEPVVFPLNLDKFVRFTLAKEPSSTRQGLALPEGLL